MRLPDLHISGRPDVEVSQPLRRAAEETSAAKAENLAKRKVFILPPQKRMNGIRQTALPTRKHEYSEQDDFACQAYAVDSVYF
ncbi:hypothetical protein [Shinella sp. G-2]|uniref:hypothetical protein n=1 Tax=Shinella sp. G-2 TaxID=3133141 RepID=UPI003D06EBBA